MSLQLLGFNITNRLATFLIASGGDAKDLINYKFF